MLQSSSCLHYGFGAHPRRVGKGPQPCTFEYVIPLRQGRALRATFSGTQAEWELFEASMVPYGRLRRVSEEEDKKASHASFYD